MRSQTLAYWIPALWILGLFAAAPAFGQELTLDTVFERPEGRLPRRIKFSPDGKRLTYLLAGKGGLSDLWAMDLASGERTILVASKGRQKLSPAEQAARERRRERGKGVTDYAWRPHTEDILIPRSGDLYLWRKGELKQLTKTKAHERNPRWSPNGRYIAYVRDGDLYVLEADWGKETKLTTGATAGIRHGLPEFIAMEELGRHDGFWWEPGSLSIVYVTTDATRVQSFQIPRLLDERNRPTAQRYPRAGDPNVQWRLFEVDLKTRQSKPIGIEDEYLVRVDWSAGLDLYVQTANRAQTSLKLWTRTKLVHEEKDEAWVRFHNDLCVFPDGRVLWPSEKSGRKHLYLDGKPVTRGDWDVASLVQADWHQILFLASIENPFERRLYSIRPDGTDQRVLTPEPGWHSISISDDGKWIVDSYSRASVPPRVVLRDAAGKVVHEIAVAKPVAGLVQPEFVRVGKEKLHAMVFRANRESPGPAIVYVYGGPGSHLVADRWRGASGLWHQRMVQRGYTVFSVDGRGTSGYGRDFCRIVNGRLCHHEVKSQVVGARWLAAQPEVDPKRVGIWGWSYGGTMTLQCLQEAGETFAAGVSVAPVTDWHDYDTAYTERYLGLPKDNPESYKLSSPLFGAHKLKRPLLLAHGAADDNVHFVNAMRYIDRVQKAGQLIEMDIWPRGKHGIGGTPERKLLFRRIERFFDRELQRGD